MDMQGGGRGRLGRGRHREAEGGTGGKGGKGSRERRGERGRSTNQVHVLVAVCVCAILEWKIEMLHGYCMCGITEDDINHEC